jgi:hypothetical protein
MASIAASTSARRQIEAKKSPSTCALGVLKHQLTTKKRSAFTLVFRGVDPPLQERNEAVLAVF